MSGISVEATGGNTYRDLSDWLADAVFIEGFGAKGDGTTDDTAALTDAIASLKPVRFGPKTYLINGSININKTTAFIGIPGLSVIRRGAIPVAGDSFFYIGGSASSQISFVAQGITFDANSSLTTSSGATVTFGSYCTFSYFQKCSLLNNATGNGIAYAAQSSTGVVASHRVVDSEIAFNQGSGIYSQALDGLYISSCLIHDNTGNGVAFQPQSSVLGRYSQIIGNRCWNNSIGIGIGSYNPSSGPTNQNTYYCIISENICYSNNEYGIAAQGDYLLVSNNICTGNPKINNGGAGILINGANTTASENTITNNTGATPPFFGYGIDSGGSTNVRITNNKISFCDIAINCGGSTNVVVSQNFIDNCSGAAIDIQVAEGENNTISFPVITGNIVVSNNQFYIPAFASSSNFGVSVYDGAQGVSLTNNSFYGQSDTNALIAKTDSIYIKGNTFNNNKFQNVNSVITVNGYNTLRYPDYADAIYLLVGGVTVQRIQSAYAFTQVGLVTFVKVAPGGGGSGYTSPPTVSFSTVAGVTTVATAIARISNGTVVGILMQNNGAGYSAVPTVTISAPASGTKATATAYVGLLPPILRELQMICTSPITFATTGSSPLQSNYTGNPITCHAPTSIDWLFTGTTWDAVNFT